MIGMDVRPGKQELEADSSVALLELKQRSFARAPEDGVNVVVPEDAPGPLSVLSVDRRARKHVELLGRRAVGPRPGDHHREAIAELVRPVTKRQAVRLRLDIEIEERGPVPDPVVSIRDGIRFVVLTVVGELALREQTREAVIKPTVYVGSFPDEIDLGLQNYWSGS